MRKVLILSNSSSGLYSFRYELVERLAKDYEVYISLPDETSNKEFEKIGCHMIKTPINRRGMNPLQDMSLFKAYLKLIREIKPDVALTYTIKPNVYGGLACRLKKVPYLPNITGLGSALENGGVVQKIALTLYKLGLKEAKCVFLQNSANKEFFEKQRITKSRLQLIPGSGVNLSRFEVLDMPENKRSFIYISRVMKEKGIEELLYAAEKIREKYKDSEFHILGACEEDYEGTLRDMQDKGIIRYHGNVPDVRPYLQNVACLTHPSFYPEGMSNVCLEAAASGRAVITTDRAGCRETVDDMNSGYVIPVRNKEALFDAIERFIALSDDDKVKMGMSGRNHVEKNFDRNIIINSYLKEIEEVCGK